MFLCFKSVRTVTLFRTLWCVFLIQLTSAEDRFHHRKYTEDVRQQEENGFTQRDMALMLGVSRRTVENRFSEFTMTHTRRFSDIDDQSLDVYVQRIVSHFPRSDEFSTQDIYSGSVSWRPYSNLKEYHNFQDVEVYSLNVPAYTSEMELTFKYVGYYSGSHEPCNNTITVLLQHGSPAVPYRDAINSKSFLFNNSHSYKTVISLHKQKQRNITSPFPGIWYVTSFLPYVEKNKKIKEKGLSKPDEKCLCGVIVLKRLKSPAHVAVVIARGQTLQKFPNISELAVDYYQYFVPERSSRLRIELNCSLKINCSLQFSVSAKALPSAHSPSCTLDHSCVLDIEWPEPATNYYIKVTGISFYEITVNHTDCKQSEPACFPLHEMTYVRRVGLKNRWPIFVLNGTQAIYSLDVLPNYVGTTLSLGLAAQSTDNNATYKMCIRKDSPPLDLLNSSSEQYCSSKNISDHINMKVLFPQPGKWYIGVAFQSETHNPENAQFVLFAQANACLDPDCNGHGSCMVTGDFGLSYGVCFCDYGYTGWTCADYHGIDILAICLLTISNIAFVAGIIVACKRKFFPEAIVYLFNMYCSTVYHACDSHGYCIYDYNTLQLSDFFASVLSVWFTLMTMVKLSPLWHRTINMLALLCLFLGIQLSRFGVTVIAAPAGVGLGIVFISFALKCYNRHKLYPNCRRWLFFILPAAVLAIVAIVVYTLLETTSNYKYLHSIWHICIALCIPLLLPSVRKARLSPEYNMIQQLDEENFTDSAESLLLNPWNTTRNDDGVDTENNEITREPQLIGENNLRV